MKIYLKLLKQILDEVIRGNVTPERRIVLEKRVKKYKAKIEEWKSKQ